MQVITHFLKSEIQRSIYVPYQIIHQISIPFSTIPGVPKLCSITNHHDHASGLQHSWWC